MIQSCKTTIDEKVQEEECIQALYRSLNDEFDAFLHSIPLYEMCAFKGG